MRRFVGPVALVAVALIFSAVSPTGYAAAADGQPPAQGGVQSPPRSNPSYFKGTWSGRWPDGSDVTIGIGPRMNTGNHETHYQSESGKSRSRRENPPASANGNGLEQGDAFTFRWKAKDGTVSTIRLEKFTADMVKASLDMQDQSSGASIAHYETHLQRK